MDIEISKHQIPNKKGKRPQDLAEARKKEGGTMSRKFGKPKSSEGVWAVPPLSRQKGKAKKKKSRDGKPKVKLKKIAAVRCRELS